MMEGDEKGGRRENARTSLVDARGKNKKENCVKESRWRRTKQKNGRRHSPSRSNTHRHDIPLCVVEEPIKPACACPSLLRACTQTGVFQNR